MTKFEEEHIKFNNEYGNCKSVNYHKAVRNHFKDWIAPQALPVVPEDVAKWIEDLKSKGYGPLKNPVTYGEAISDLSDESLEKILTWISQHQEEFMRAWLDGYTVEKPQLFYLKNMLTGLYLYRLDGLNYDEQHYCKDSHNKPLDYCLFTQSEIDSMHAESYEKIEVEE